MRNKAKLGWAAVSGEGALGEPVVQNEANFDRTRYPTIPLFHYSSIPTRRRSCETKPIPGGAGWDGATAASDEGENVQNEAKLGKDGISGGQRIRGANSAKRTQFPPAPGETRPQGRGTKGIVRNEANLRRNDGHVLQQLDNMTGRAQMVCGYIEGVRCFGGLGLSGERSLLRQKCEGGRIVMTRCGHLVALAHE